jgi:hypothetical protein
MNFMIRAKRIFVGILTVIWFEGVLGQDVNVKVQQGTLMGVSVECYKR